MFKKLPIKGWLEQDFLTKWRHVIYSQRGEIRKVKRRYSKRVRRFGKKEISRQLLDDNE